MVLALLAVLNVSSLCVPHTDICAPAGSTIVGTISHSGGQVTITPSKPLRALGAEFRASTRVFVNVLAWGSSDGTRGAIVQVTGELTKETVINGARVAGIVRIGQIQGRKSKPQLVEATNMKGGQLQIGASGAVDVGPGMKLDGHVDIGRVRLDITSRQPIRALGLELEAGTVRIEHGDTGVTIDGTLVRPQAIGGVLVEQQVRATIGGRVPVFSSATLAQATPLSALGLPDGEAPAGTVVHSMPAATLLIGPGPVTVCGLPLAPVATVSRPAVTFTPSGPNEPLSIRGALAGADVDVGGGLRMTGGITLRYAAGSCQRLGIEGTLARPTTQRGLHFAANTAFTAGELAHGQHPILRGTLARPAVVNRLHLSGGIMVHVPSATEMHLLDGTLAKPTPFEQWELPPGTHIQFSSGRWSSFKTPRGRSARARGLHRGERVDGVTEAHSDDLWASFTLQRPHTPKGTTLALRSIGIEHQTGCVSGDVATAQQHDIFRIPRGGNATLCGGTVVAAVGNHAVPSLQVGRWFATQAIAGDRASPPPSDIAPSLLTPPTAAASTPPTGYWIQIHSLCQRPSGIPQPPPKQRWIWVDRKGDSPSAAERKELAADAAKAGTACPVTPCCPP